MCQHLYATQRGCVEHSMYSMFNSKTMVYILLILNGKGALLFTPIKKLLFVGPLILLLWTSGDGSSGFQSQSG